MAFKHVHLLFVGLTFLLFVVRSGGLLLGFHGVNKAWVKRSHHLIDLLVLLSALMLCYTLNLWPFYNSDWVTAKFVGLLVYMGLAGFALRRRSYAGLLLALLLLFYIVWVAINKQPFPLPMPTPATSGA
ncbi:SirB2 family protein [Marinospirillum perlucidum]|uniref:SirB2 family protein n=1 Tax=Marinospirillum perlucidum TaxID=1982602 RepID=UPI00138FB339|nr:SirB2 family protein [Marinospirillum perlucidum]